MAVMLEAHNGPILLLAGYLLGSLVSIKNYNTLSEQMLESYDTVSGRLLEQSQQVQNLTEEVRETNSLQATLIALISVVCGIFFLVAVGPFIWRLSLCALGYLVRGTHYCLNALMNAVGHGRNKIIFATQYCWNTLTSVIQHVEDHLTNVGQNAEDFILLLARGIIYPFTALEENQVEMHGENWEESDEEDHSDVDEEDQLAFNQKAQRVLNADYLHGHKNKENQTAVQRMDSQGVIFDAELHNKFDNEEDQPEIDEDSQR